MRPLRINWALSILNDLRKHGIRGGLRGDDEIVVFDEPSEDKKRTIKRILSKYEKTVSHLPKIKFVRE